jgi:hypothetical protein
VEVGGGIQWCVRVAGGKLDFGGFDVNISAVRSRRPRGTAQPIRSIVWDKSCGSPSAESVETREFEMLRRILLIHPLTRKCVHVIVFSSFAFSFSHISSRFKLLTWLTFFVIFDHLCYF